MIFAWQEDYGANAGLLLVHHLLATGDLDPEWPAYGRVACGVPATRTELVLREDGVGGAYALWLEDRSLYLLHLEPSGAVTPGWPEKGLLLSTTANGPARAPGIAPRLIADGEGGVFVGWLEAGRRVFATRIGRDSRATGGWPASPVLFNPGGGLAGLAYAPAFARGAGGGLIACWYEVDWDGAVFGERRLRIRALRDASGHLPPNGATLDVYSREDDRDLVALTSTRAVPAAVTAAPDGGVRVLRWQPDAENVYGAGRLAVSELGPDGVSLWDLTVGEDLQVYPVGSRTPRGARFELQNQPDGGFRIINAGIADQSNPRFGPDRLPIYDTGTWAGLPWGFEASADLDVWGYSSLTMGIAPYSWVDSHHGDVATVRAVLKPLAGARVVQVDHTEGFTDDSAVGPYQYRSEKWFQAGTIRSTRDGGGMLIYSQLKRPLALMAARVGPVFAAVGSDPGSVGRLAPQLAFKRGAGLLVRGAPGLASEVSVELYDLQGAHVASGRGPSGGAEWLVPGTLSIASGVFFARIEWAGQQLTRRVVVLR